MQYFSLNFKAQSTLIFQRKYAKIIFLSHLSHEEEFEKMSEYLVIVLRRKEVVKLTFTHLSCHSL